MNQTQKQQIIQQLEQHYRNDEIVKGKYWQDGKGCAIGCIVHSDSRPHEKVAEMLGIPLWMSYLFDELFEGSPNKDAKEFPLRFVKALPENADKQKLEMIRHKLALYQLNYICKNTDHSSVKDAIDKIWELHQKVIDGKKVSTEEWSAARSAAWSATWSAANSARSALLSAANSAAKTAAETAAWSAESAAESAELAVWSVESAAWSAAWSAAETAWTEARQAAYKKIADKLIEYVREAATQ